MAAGGFVPIDRGNRSRAIEGLSLAARRLQEGRSLVVFPEGTRSRDGALLPFKKGPFHLALTTGRPVVPVAISGTRRLLPPGSLGVRSGSVLVRFAPPVAPALYGPDGIARFAGDVRDAIARLLEEGA
jgi:1-acyl-sn-glycerol-3-phosphate acyltransferase